MLPVISDNALIYVLASEALLILGFPYESTLTPAALAAFILSSLPFSLFNSFRYLLASEALLILGVPSEVVLIPAFFAAKEDTALLICACVALPLLVEAFLVVLGEAVTAVVALAVVADLALAALFEADVFVAFFFEEEIAAFAIFAATLLLALEVFDVFVAFDVFPRDAYAAAVVDLAEAEDFFAETLFAVVLTTFVLVVDFVVFAVALPVTVFTALETVDLTVFAILTTDDATDMLVFALLFFVDFTAAAAFATANVDFLLFVADDAFLLDVFTYLLALAAALLFAELLDLAALDVDFADVDFVVLDA